MAMDSFSLIQFEVYNFHNVLLSTRPPFTCSTLLLKLLSALIEAEPNPDEEMRARVKWLYENTHPKVNYKIAIVEDVVISNVGKGINKELEIGDKAFYFYELKGYLDEISLELLIDVIKICKKYNLEIPISMPKSTQISLT